MIRYSVVIPTIGRPCLRDCLAALGTATGPAPEQVVVVDDRPARSGPLDVGCVAAGPGPASLPVRLVTSGGAGPAAACNVGWRVTETPWVAFLDDDVRVSRDWRSRLAEDLAGVPSRVTGVQGRIIVPVPGKRRPTDWERNTQGLADANWITADMAYRRDALAEAGGFDERFPRAFRQRRRPGAAAAGRWLAAAARAAVHRASGPARLAVGQPAQSGGQRRRRADAGAARARLA